MIRRGYNRPRRVWYLHHAESETLYKTYYKHNVALAEREQCDIINRDTYEHWKKKYGHEKEFIFEESARGQQVIWDDDIPF